jgi:hypothetical protein
MSGARIPTKLHAIRMIGADEGDQFFMLKGVGTFNIAKIGRDFARDPHMFRGITVRLVPAFVERIRASNDVDEAYLATLTRADVETSVAIALEGDGPNKLKVIDGTNYIVKAYEFGETECRVVMVPKALEHRYRIRFEGCVLPGLWFELPVDELAERMHGIYTRPDGSIVDTRSGEAKVFRRPRKLI